MKKSRFCGMVCLLIAMLMLASCGGTSVTGGATSDTTGTPIVSTGEVGAPILTIDTSEMDLDISNRDTKTEYDEGDATVITFADSGSIVVGAGATTSGSDVVITAAGTYVVSGAASDASLTIAADDSEKIQLVLHGVTLTNEEGPAILISCADKVFLTLADGTVNTLSDGNAYAATDGETTLDAALFSREDLTVNGSGALVIKGNYKHGIVSKDDLIITGGTITVTSVKAGICGKDCVKITDGVITVTAGSDAIRSDNDEDATRGFVYISGGTLYLTAGNDGIDAETALIIEGGELSIRTGGGSANASTTSTGGRNPNWGFGGTTTTAASTESAKGMKAGTLITVSGGTMTVDSADDAIHTNGNSSIVGGTFTLSSGDDGIHADTALAISGGTIAITKSYEGLESTEITIAGGNISVVSSDDGMNAAGGSDSSALGGRPGQGMFSSSTGVLTISGGTTYIKASGDGVDSNGSIYVSGGMTVVAQSGGGNGPVDIGDKAQDQFVVTGGIFVAYGGMFNGNADNPAATSTQGTIRYQLAASAGSYVTLKDDNGNVILTVKLQTSCSNIYLSAPQIQKSSTYTIWTGGTPGVLAESGLAVGGTLTGGSKAAEVTMTSVLYNNCSGGMGGGGFGRR